MSGRNRGGKRRRDDDDFHYTPRDDGRGPQRPRHDDGPRRSRIYASVELRERLVNIASSTKLPEDEAIEIAEYLRDNYDDEEARNEFFDALVLLCVLLAPWSWSFANLVQLRRTAAQDSICRRRRLLRQPDQV
jgi:nuclear cap-binding protein subunit 1